MRVQTYQWAHDQSR